MIKFFTSLRLTVTLLSLGIVLVFVGTVAQADEGLYVAQDRYFKHWFVWGISFFGYKVPLLLPGGYLIGTVLLVNLTAAFIKRFQWTTKKLGVHLTHIGIILLLVGQLATDLFSRETQLRFDEGQGKWWTESGTEYELAFATEADAKAETERVVAIPAGQLTAGRELRHADMPFTVRVRKAWRNSDLNFRAPAQQNAAPLTTNGVANSYDFRELPLTYKMNEKNIPTVVIEILDGTKSFGEWVASGWAGDDVMVSAVEQSFMRQMGHRLGANMVEKLRVEQAVESGGRKYRFTLRPTRAYLPFTMTLLKTTHQVYPGTKTASMPEGIPKDFRSRVRIQNPSRGEDREVEIFMNSPLRYAGLTFFQYQMAGEEMAAQMGQAPSSTLQVVRNPSWITPYAGCVVVSAGMIVQFMIHLVGFLSRRKKATV